jgi:hypothetical protein
LAEGISGIGNIEYAIASGMSPRSKDAIIPLTVSWIDAAISYLLKLYFSGLLKDWAVRLNLWNVGFQIVRNPQKSVKSGKIDPEKHTKTPSFGYIFNPML